MDETSRAAVVARTLAASVLVLVGPGIAFVVCISWRIEPASDAQHVMWFVTTAGICLVVGAVAPSRPWLVLVLSAPAVVATLGTLYLWWSSVDVTGLFGVGIMLATPGVVIAAPLLLSAGAVLSELPARDARRLRPTPRGR